MDSKKYNNIKLSLSIGKGIAVFIITLFFVSTGLSAGLQNFLSGYITNSYLVFVSFALTSGLALGILFFPLSYYSEFYLEHKYNLSNQTLYGWLGEDLKGLLVSLPVIIPVLLVFFYSLNKFDSLWWLPFAIVLFIISVVLARIVPVLVLPLFYKITPLEQNELKEKIQEHAKDAGIVVENVYKFNMSKNTKKANAAFTGIGKSKRILLGDTLIENFTADEIETVVCHELGHYKRKHIIKNIFIGTLFSFLTLFLIAALYQYSVSWFGFGSFKEIAAMPLLALWAMVIRIILTPVSNIISRKFEFEADEYAVQSTGKKDAFVSTLNKLTDQNLGDREPHPFVEWFFYSHPSIKNRVAAINEFYSRVVGSSGSVKREINLEGN